MEKPLETAWVGLRVGWDTASGNHQSGVNSVSQVGGISAIAPACQLCGSEGRTQKRNNGLCQHFSLGESCPPVLAVMLDNSVPPYMSLMPFNLLPPCWNLEGGVQASQCAGPLRGAVWDSSSFCLPQPQSLLVFIAINYGTSWDCSPGLGLLTPQLSFLIFIRHMWCGTSPSASPPLLPVSLWFLL